MAVAKRQGRSKDQSEDFRQNKQHSWLSPICIGQAQVEEKTYKRRSQSAFSRTLSPVCMCARSLALSLSLSLSLSLTMHSSTLFSSSLGFSCYLIKWSCNTEKKKKKTDLFQSCGTAEFSKFSGMLSFGFFS